MSNLVNSVTVSLDQSTRQFKQAFDGSSLLNLFQTGNVIQLISRSSRRALQIVQAPDGRLVVDGMGPPDPHATNTHWTVIGSNAVGLGFTNPIRLQNNNNFLGISPLNAYIQPSTVAFLDKGTKLEITQMGNFVSIGSTQYDMQHLGICPNGMQKAPAVTTHLDLDSHFEVRFISQMVYAPAAPAPVIILK